jgi:hypothetical protein
MNAYVLRVVAYVIVGVVLWSYAGWLWWRGKRR